MSQHILVTQLGNKNVQLILGWDRALKQYFYSLTDLALGLDDSILGSSLTMDYEDLYDIDAILDELKQLGVTPPAKMVEEAQIDEVNREGNRVEHYQA